MPQNSGLYPAVGKIMMIILKSTSFVSSVANFIDTVISVDRARKQLLLSVVEMNLGTEVISIEVHGTC